jgi:hypothetical protein
MPGCSDHQDSRHYLHIEAVGLRVANDGVDVAGLDDDWLSLCLALPTYCNIFVEAWPALLPGMSKKTLPSLRIKRSLMSVFLRLKARSLIVTQRGFETSSP